MTPAFAKMSRRRFAGMAAAVGLIGAQPAQATPSRGVLSWLNRQATPLRTLEPAGPGLRSGATAANRGQREDRRARLQRTREGPRDTPIPPPHPSFVDHTLGRVRYDNYLLDLHPRGAAPEVKQWLHGPAKLRGIASPYDPANDAAYKMMIDPWQVGFDAVLFIREVTTARMFP